MLKRLTSAKEYIDFINEINRDSNFSDPMLSNEEQIRCNLLDAPDKPSNQIWGVFEEARITGLFVFLILEEESYIEMLVGLSRSQKAYEEMLSFLKETYKGCLADFVYNPGNHLLHELLREEKAQFETEQQKMVLKKEVPYQSSHQTETYSPKYREQYIVIHSKDCYWTAEKVIDAPDRFRIILAIEEGEVVGYNLCKSVIKPHHIMLFRSAYPFCIELSHPFFSPNVAPSTVSRFPVSFSLSQWLLLGACIYAAQALRGCHAGKPGGSWVWNADAFRGIWNRQEQRHRRSYALPALYP